MKNVSKISKGYLTKLFLVTKKGQLLDEKSTCTSSRVMIPAWEWSHIDSRSQWHDKLLPKGLETAQKAAQKLAGLGMRLAPGFAHSPYSYWHASLIHLMESNPKGGPLWLAWNYMAQTKHIKYIRQIGLWPLVAAGLQGGQKSLLLSGHWKSATRDADGGRDGLSKDSK